MSSTQSSTSDVTLLLAMAQRDTAVAIATMRSSLADSSSVTLILDDVDRLFAMIDAVDAYTRFAQTAADPADRLEYAVDARFVARRALEEAGIRARIAQAAK